MIGDQASNPSCSIVIPVFNNRFYTRLCLEGLKKTRSTEPPYEVIVVDNGSTDGTGDLLDEYHDEIYRVVSNPTNLGFAVASNQGAAIARGKYVVFLNNDIVVEPGWLKALVDAAQFDSTAGAVGSRLLFPDGTIQHAGVVFGPDHHPDHAFAGYPGDWPEALVSRYYQASTGACLLIEKDLFKKVGGFDESYHNSFEDMDLCFKIRRLGLRILYCPDSVGYHFESATPGRFRRDNVNLSLFFERWGDEIEVDFDPEHRSFPRAFGAATKMRLEFEALTNQSQSLAAQNSHLKRLLERARLPLGPSLSPDPFFGAGRAHYDLLYHPAPLATALSRTEVLVPIVVENLGSEALPAGRLFLTYRWQPLGAEEYLAWDRQGAVLEEPLEPSHPVSLSVKVAIPETPGAYLLEWDTLENGLAWFSSYGVTPFSQLVTVHEPGCHPSLADELVVMSSPLGHVDVEEDAGSLQHAEPMPRSEDPEPAIDWQWLAEDALYLLARLRRLVASEGTSPQIPSQAEGFPSEAWRKRWPDLISANWLEPPIRFCLQEIARMKPQLAEAQRQIGELTDLVEGYRNGKVMRTLSALSGLPGFKGRL